MGRYDSAGKPEKIPVDKSLGPSLRKASFHSSERPCSRTGKPPDTMTTPNNSNPSPVAERPANAGCVQQACSARVLPHELDAKRSEIIAVCWKCHCLIAFTGCHTYKRISAYGGQTIIFQPDRYYAACPECGCVQLEEYPQNS